MAEKRTSRLSNASRPSSAKSRPGGAEEDARRPSNTTPCPVAAAKHARTIEKIKDAFKRWDRDGNGILSRNEICSLMKSIGGTVSPAELNKVFEQVDTNGDDGVDTDEFIEWIMSPASRLNVQNCGEVTQFNLQSALKPLFDVYDVDRSGSINMKEFKELHSIIQGAIQASEDSLLSTEVGAYEDCERVFKQIDEDNSQNISLEEFVGWQREAIEDASVSKERFVELVAKLAALMQSLNSMGGIGSDLKAARSSLEKSLAPLKEQVANITKELYSGDLNDVRANKTHWEAFPPHICKQTLLRTHMKIPVPTNHVEDISFIVCPCVPESDHPSTHDKRRGYKKAARWFAKVLRKVRYKAGGFESSRPKGKAKGKAKAKPKARNAQQAEHRETREEPNSSDAAAERIDTTAHYYVYEARDESDGLFEWWLLKDDKDYLEAFHTLSDDFKFLAILVTEMDFGTYCSWGQLDHALSTAVGLDLMLEEQYETFKTTMLEFAEQALTVQSYKDADRLSDHLRQMLIQKYLENDFKFMAFETMNLLMDCGLTMPHPLWKDCEDPLWKEAKPERFQTKKEDGRSSPSKSSVCGEQTIDALMQGQSSLL